MIARRVCIALLLIAFTFALVPADAHALPDRAAISEMTRPWGNVFSRVHSWLSRVLALAPPQFVATEGASISTGG